ncbi:acyltransferase (plasmid) [Sinorhizobium sp. B11]
MQVNKFENHQVSTNIPHIGALDDLRGIAALMVFFAHIVHNLTRGVDASMGAWLKPNNPLFAILAEGHAGVSLFMVLSGFLFAYGAHGSEVRYWCFVRNRILRIYPMYLLLLFFAAYSSPSQFSFESFIASAALFSNTGNALKDIGFTALLWTISVEFLFYLIFPFLNRFKNAFGIEYLFRLLVLLIILRYLAIGLGASARDISYFTIIGRIDQFLIGMIVASLYREGRLTLKHPRLCLAGSIVLVLLSLFALNRMGGWIQDAEWKGIWHTYEAIIFSALIITYLFSHSALNPRYKSLMARIGLVSYSMYLLHMPVLLLLQRKHWYAKVTGNLYWDALITACYLFPVVFLLSSATYELIEKPFMSFRTRYLAPIGTNEIAMRSPA